MMFDIPYNCFALAVEEGYKRLVVATQGGDAYTEREDLHQFLAGGAAGLVAWLVLFPQDKLKTLAQSGARAGEPGGLLAFAQREAARTGVFYGGDECPILPFTGEISYRCFTGCRKMFLRPRKIPLRNFSCKGTSGLFSPS